MHTDPKLLAILDESARGRVKTERYGHKGDYTRLLVGITAVAIDAGELSSKIGWGINGLDIGISSDVESHIDCFTIEHILVEAVMGYYPLRNRSGHILAEARVAESIGGTKIDVYVRGKDRADVVKLFEQIRDGETAPEAAGGRRGLISNLREQIAGLLVSTDELVEYKVAYERQVKDILGHLEHIAKLEIKNIELQKPKGFWQVFRAKFREAYAAQVA